jgi:hypothetical protein
MNGIPEGSDIREDKVFAYRMPHEVHFGTSAARTPAWEAAV